MPTLPDTPALPDTPSALVLRTDFSDDLAWDAVRVASTALSAEGFGANVFEFADNADPDGVFRGFPRPAS
jgi:hypothetical protein